MPKVKGQKSSKVMLSKKEAKAVRGLIQGDTKEFGPVITVAAGGTGSADWDETIVVQCPYSYSSAAFANSPFVNGFGQASVDGNALIGTNAATLKFIEFRGHHLIEPVAPAAGQTPVVVRTVVVWFYKPLTPLTNAGELPPATEVFAVPYIGASIGVDSPFVDQSANSGRFHVLSDKTWNLGTSTIDAVAGGCQNGKNRVDFAYKVVVNKVSHSTGDQLSLRPLAISRGFPMVYTFTAGNGGTLRSLTVAKITVVG